MISTIQSFFHSSIITQILKYLAMLTPVSIIVRLFYDLNKDRIKVAVYIKRDNISSLAKQNPSFNFFYLEVVNKSATPVTINEVGIVTKSKQYLNLIDMPHSFIRLKKANATMGTIEGVAIPGTINPGGLGLVRFSFSSLEKAYKTYKTQELSPETPEYIGTIRLLNAYDEFMKFYDEKTKTLKLKPYVITTIGKRFVGKKSIIRLGNLHEILVPIGTNNSKSEGV